MSRIYIPADGPTAWRRLLADPEKHWKAGYSAFAVAHSWEDAGGLPPEIKVLFDDPELLIALPEHKTALPGGSRNSQSDVFALMRAGGATLAAAIEGKVNETFGPSVGEWLVEASPGKTERMIAICSRLGLSNPPPADIRYQLLHRTASAVIEAERFKTDAAAMIVQSFSPTRIWFDEFAKFARLFGVEVEAGKPHWTTLASGRKLMLAWVAGEERFLKG